MRKNDNKLSTTKQNKDAISWLMLRSKKQNFKMALLIIANAVFSVLSILFAFAIKEIIDSATKYQDINRLISYSVAIGVIVILQFVFRIITNALLEHIRGKLEMDYKTHIFSSILEKKQDKISLYHSGELMNRLTADVAIVADGMSSIVPLIVASVVRLICAVVALIILDWIFSLSKFLYSKISKTFICSFEDKL
jgi:ABC-type bacteriocin/lantibiotic exporter with double-glycine peptidase domain